VNTLDFGDQNTTAWGAPRGLEQLLSTVADRLYYLKAGDPVTGQVYVWGITVSASGAVRITESVPVGSLQPALTMRIDTLRGEWTGSYTDADGIRRTLHGIPLLPKSESDVWARGWIETGSLPGIQTGEWSVGPER
jgi:hypothetical protein